MPSTYGELPGTQSGDGQPVNVYLLGWDTPVQLVWGEVTAVLLRTHDREDKLVVARAATVGTDKEIMQAGSVQERFFQTSLRR